jgi:hypothetical protein
MLLDLERLIMLSFSGFSFLTFVLDSDNSV